MNGRFFLAALAATILSLALGFVVYGLVLDNFFKAHSGLDADTMAKVYKPDDQMNWLFMILSCAAGGFLMTFIVYWSNARSFAGGMKVGAIIGLLMAASYDLGFLAYTNVYQPISAFADILGSMITGAIIGGVIAIILSKRTTEPLAA